MLVSENGVHNNSLVTAVSVSQAPTFASAVHCYARVQTRICIYVCIHVTRSKHIMLNCSCTQRRCWEEMAQWSQPLACFRFVHSACLDCNMYIICIQQYVCLKIVSCGFLLYQYKMMKKLFVFFCERAQIFTSSNVTDSSSVASFWRGKVCSWE